MQKNKWFICFAILWPIASYAFFCPSNFNQIQLGDTLATVEQQCGKPDLREDKEAPANVPQEWGYFIAQTVALSGDQQAQGTLKVSITFDKDGKAINITVNGVGVGASSICGKHIQLKDTIEQIKTACGTPQFINRQQGKDTTVGTPPPTKITIFTFNSNPPKKLIFEDGKLTSTE